MSDKDTFQWVMNGPRGPIFTSAYDAEVARSFISGLLRAFESSRQNASFAKFLRRELLGETQEFLAMTIATGRAHQAESGSPSQDYAEHVATIAGDVLASKEITNMMEAFKDDMAAMEIASRIATLKRIVERCRTLSNEVGPNKSSALGLLAKELEDEISSGESTDTHAN